MIRSMRAFFLSTLLSALAAAPALADTIYKWVDDQGTVHYSNAKPADASRRPQVVSEDRISVVQAEPAVVRAAAAQRAEADYLARRIDNLERELAAQRQAAYVAALQDQSTQQAGYDTGYAGPPVIYGAAPVVAGRFSQRQGHVRPIRSFNRMNNFGGVTAGNVVTFGAARAPRR